VRAVGTQLHITTENLKDHNRLQNNIF